jgi:hypothetical protein
MTKLVAHLRLLELKQARNLLVFSIFLGVSATLTIPYGLITSSLQPGSKEYSSNQSIIRELDLDGLSDRQVSEKIFTFVASIPHGISRYSFLENPISELIEKIIRPIYDSEFLNTIREPYLLANRQGAICHQHALSMILLAESQGIDGRVIWLDGHVVAELLFEDKWNLFDANKGISLQDAQGQYQSVSDFIGVLENPNALHGWDDSISEYARNLGGVYMTEDNNHVYRYYPLESYVSAYYGVTRAMSYTLYFFAIGYFFWWLAQVRGARRGKTA